MGRNITSSVSFNGLSKLLLDLKSTIPREASSTMQGMTRELGDETLALYKENLNGVAPSTAENPLPVGVRSGDLIDGAQLDDGGTGGGTVNQYSFRIINLILYSGFIEDGTEHMAPRHPLQNALDVMAIRYKVKIKEAMEHITSYARGDS